MTRRVTMQLYEGFGGFPFGDIIKASGGVCYVATADDAAKATLTDKDGASLSNPVSLTQGGCEFYVANTVLTVDLYIQAPGGQFVVKKGVKTAGSIDLGVDVTDRDQLYMIPFAIGDTSAATETDTGFDLPTNAIVLPDGMGVYVLTADATEDIDVGILSTESGGDADGFMDAVSVATASVVALATVGFTVGANASYIDLTGGDVEFTYGIFMVGTGTKAAVSEGSNLDTDEGFYLLTPKRCDGTAVSISYTLSAGTDTAEGFIILPVRLMVP